jgi:hypothetical protein
MVIDNIKRNGMISKFATLGLCFSWGNQEFFCLIEELSHHNQNNTLLTID